MTATDLIVIAGTIFATVAASLGVVVRQLAGISRRLVALEVRMSVLEEWYRKWSTMPPDMSDATMLDRRLKSMEQRLADIERHFGIERHA
jgi:hypothetical protein